MTKIKHCTYWDKKNFDTTSAFSAHLIKYLIDANYNKYLQNELLPRSCTCSAVTDKTGNPICLVHVSMTSATGFELAWAKLAQSSSEKKKKKEKKKGMKI